MRFIGKIAKKHGKAFSVLCLCVFLLMLLCNLLTGLFVDDYVYLCNFATGERLSSFFEIFPSISVHARAMNGRTIAHFLLQAFLLLPMPVFDLINSLAFTTLIVLICKIGAGGRKNSPFLFPAVFSAIWLFTAEPGQVFLWTDGSCNYLFGITVGLLFLIPYVQAFLCDEKAQSIPKEIAFIALGFIAGGYLENTSAAVIFTAVLLVIFTSVKTHSKPKIAHCLAVLSAVGGFLFMILAPAERKNKFGGFSFGDLRRGFITALEMLKEFRVLIFFLAALFVLAIHLKLSKEKLVLSGIFALGAFFANFAMSAAKYYPGRASLAVTVFLTVACAILADEILHSENRVRICIIIALVILIICAAYYVLYGVNDIYETHLLQKENQEIISARKAAGELDVRLPFILPKTKYSAVHELKYLDEADASSWPNSSMASYYGVRSILGYR